jgi:hypothetical protein
VRLVAGACALVLLLDSVEAQTPRLSDVLARMDRYLQSYGERLASVVGEETYEQWVEEGPTWRRYTLSRMLRSDYALAFVPDRAVWVGYRDTFDVDGQPVRDRDQRLQALLSDGALGQAARIAAQNARFNLGGDVMARTVNVPTLALEMLHPRTRPRFRARRAGAEVFDGRAGWLVDFRERERPTVVRRPDGRDQPSRVLALIDAESGEVRRTVMTWEHVKGSITVTYGRPTDMPVPVPIQMSEHYDTPSGAVVGGKATYANFRQFVTSGRILP